MKKLDAEEQEILQAFDAGTLKQTANAKAEIKRHRGYAAATLKEINRINIGKPLVDAPSGGNASKNHS